MGNSFFRPIVFRPESTASSPQELQYYTASDICGAILYPDGACYYGSLQSGRIREGFGIFIPSDGVSLFQANWHADQMEGQCLWSRPNGTQVLCTYSGGNLLSLQSETSIPQVVRKEIVCIPDVPVSDDVLSESEESSSLSFGRRQRLKSTQYLLSLSSTHSLVSPFVSTSSSSMYVPRSPSRPDTWLIDIEGLIFERKLSCIQCPFCPQVWKGTWLGKDVCIRSYSNAPLTSDVLRLLSKIAQLRHPNIALFMGAGVDRANSKLSIVSEWIPTGSLADRPVVQRTSVQSIFQIAKGIAVGCAYLKKQGFAHKNLKPTNVLIDALMDVKLCDYFGKEFAQMWHPLPHCCPTAAYLAPESLRTIPFVPYGIDTASDVYAFGAILRELVSTKRQFGEFGGQLSVAQIRVLVGFAGYSEPRVKGTLRSVSRLIQLCQQPEPTQRTSFDRLVVALNTMHSSANSAAEDALISFISGR